MGPRRDRFRNATTFAAVALLVTTLAGANPPGAAAEPVEPSGHPWKGWLTQVDTWSGDQPAPQWVEMTPTGDGGPSAAQWTCSGTSTITHTTTGPSRFYEPHAVAFDSYLNQFSGNESCTGHYTLQAAGDTPCTMTVSWAAELTWQREAGDFLRNLELSYASPGESYPGWSSSGFNQAPAPVTVTGFDDSCGRYAATPETPSLHTGFLGDDPAATAPEDLVVGDHVAGTSSNSAEEGTYSTATSWDFEYTGDTCIGEAVPLVGFVGSTAPEFGSRDVEFSLDRTKVRAGNTYRIAYGDGASDPILADERNRHTYAKAGEYTAEVLATTPEGCTATAQKVVVADPVTTYAPVIHFHPVEKYFTDAVDPFLKAAVLIRDKPNRAGLSFAGCRDDVIAAGPNANVSKLKSRWDTRFSKREPRLSAARLGGATPYTIIEQRKIRTAGVFRRCKNTSTVSMSHRTGAAKTGLLSNAKDTGLVLSLRGAPSAVKLGSRDRTQLYVTYQPGHFIRYWIFSPYNDWKTATGKVGITERHEGDWEHIIVHLRPLDDRMTSVGYYQHYCDEQTFDAAKLALEDGTHPPVWSALGGHASYHKNVGTKIASCVKGVRQGVTDQTGDGKALRTWVPGSSGTSRLLEAKKQPWYRFQGAWGDPIKAVIPFYGPKGPGAQER